MRRHRIVSGLLAIAFAVGAAGCTDAAQPTGQSPTSSATSSPSATSPSTGGGTTLTADQAQLALADTLAAIDAQGSLAFTSQAQNVVDGGVGTISGTGIWVKKPLAWKTSTSFTTKKPGPSDPLDEPTIDLIYLGSHPCCPYSRATFAGQQLGWSSAPGNGVTLGGNGVWLGVTRADLTSPPAIRILSLIQASAATTIGDTMTISGTIPSAWAFDALGISDYLAGLGYANRLADSTTRVLVAIGPDALPRTLAFAGTTIDVANADLADYVIDELSGARYFAEYSKATLKHPIQAPKLTAPRINY